MSTKFIVFAIRTAYLVDFLLKVSLVLYFSNNVSLINVFLHWLTSSYLNFCELRLFIPFKLERR